MPQIQARGPTFEVLRALLAPWFQDLICTHVEVVFTTGEVEILT